MPLRRLLAVLAALVLGLAACGGDDEGTSAEASAESGTEDTDGGDDDDGAEVGDGACALLDTDAVADLLGQDVEDGQEQAVGEEATLCSWFTEEQSQVVDRPITLKIEWGEISDEVSTAIDELQADEANDELDLGDRSVLVCGLGADGASCDTFDEVVIEIDGTYLEVDLTNWGYPDDFSKDDGLQIVLDAAEQAGDALG